MKFTILSVAYPFAPVRPDTAGGAEQVLGMLDQGIVQAGHDSVVVACKGSQVRGELIPTSQVEGDIDDSQRPIVYCEYNAAIERAIEKYHPDLIHMHGIDFDKYLPPQGPVLVTLHLPIPWYSHGVFSSSRPETYFNCVSQSQFQTCPPSDGLTGFIENGVDTDSLGIDCDKSTYAISLGRICPEKGYHIALDAAREAGVPMLIAGQLFKYPAYERYYVEQILPRLDGRQYQFIGPVGPVQKSELLSKARCLLAPSLAPETSSLVAMESLACGTAVVAFGAGALGDIVENGKTGFLVRDKEEMTAAIGLASLIDTEQCRETARQRFSCKKMIDSYLRLYETIIEKKSTSC